MRNNSFYVFLSFKSFTLFYMEMGEQFRIPNVTYKEEIMD